MEEEGSRNKREAERNSGYELDYDNAVSITVNGAYTPTKDGEIYVTGKSAANDAFIGIHRRANIPNTQYSIQLGVKEGDEVYPSTNHCTNLSAIFIPYK